jgi:NAD(P)-dependent dehydrogenase (short-subunit alcohol dehydrogenase family)
MSQLPTVDLQGRVALVLGGGRGIGRASADVLAAAGAAVVVADSDPDDLARVEARLSVATVESDFSAPGSSAAAVAAAVERFGRLDILICAQTYQPGSDDSFDEYRRVQAVNLDSSFLCIQDAAGAMASGGAGGRIVILVRSRTSARGPGSAAYDASQAGLRELVRSAALEHAPSRITVNGVVCGWIRGEAGDDGETVKSPTGLVGEPEDAARAVLWFVDPDNSFVTGTAVFVDGGQAAMGPQTWAES